MITTATDNFGQERKTGVGGILIDGSSITVENAGGLVINPGGVLTWKKGTISHLLFGPLATISNFGVMNITGSRPHVLNNATIGNVGQLTISGSITGNQTSAISGDNPRSVIILDRRSAPIDVGVKLDNTKELRVSFGTDATFSRSVDQLSGGTLGGGHWIVNDQAKLTLTPASGSPDISVISDKAFVELRGTGKLNNLTNVIGDFSLRSSSKLFLRNVGSYNVSGQFNIVGAGELRLFNSNLTVAGDFEMGSNILDALGITIKTTLVVDSASRLIIRDQFEVLSGAIVNMNGVLKANSLDIQNGGSFAGSGVINGQKFTNSGELKPGNSPGILTINGDYTQTSTGVLAIELGGFVAGTEYDQLIVNGTATFEAGSSIEITLLDLDGDGEVFIPKGRSSFDIIVADSLILPTGADLANLVSVTNAPNGLRVSLAPSGAGFGFKLLTVFGSTLLDLGSQFTPGQNNVAAALDGASTGTATDGLLDFALAIDDLSTVAAKKDAIEQAGLSFASSLFAMSRIGSDAGHNQIDRHFDSMIWAVASPSSPVAKASYAPSNLVAMSYGPAAQGAMNDVGDFIGFAKNLAGNGTSTLSSGDGMGFFVAGSYEFGNYDATRNQTGFDYNGASATIGIDYGNSEQGWTVGVAGSASTLNGTIDLGRGTVDSKTYGMSGYGLIQTENNVSLDAAVSYGWVSNDYRRSVTIPGQGFTANGNVDGNYFTATARLAWAGEYGAGRIGPFAQIRYSRVDLDASQETGGGDASLIIGSGIEKFTTGQIGLRGSTAIKTDWGVVLPHLSAAWNYVLDQTAPTLTAHFIGGPDDSFLIPTDDYDRGGLAVNAGLVIEQGGSLSFSLDYQGLLFNKDYRNHSLTGHARWAF